MYTLTFCREGELAVIQGTMPEYLEKLGREIKPVKGDGFCLLHAIAVALYMDHDMLFQVEDLKQTIIAHVSQRRTQLQDFYLGGDVLGDVLTFFETRNYNKEVGDLILEICVNAIYIQVRLILEHVDGTKIPKTFSPGPGASTIYLHLKHDPQHAAGNHYNPLVLRKAMKTAASTEHDYSKKKWSMASSSRGKKKSSSVLGKTKTNVTNPVGGPKKKYTFMKRVAPVPLNDPPTPKKKKIESTLAQTSSQFADLDLLAELCLIKTPQKVFPSSSTPQVTSTISYKDTPHATIPSMSSGYGSMGFTPASTDVHKVKKKFVTWDENVGCFNVPTKQEEHIDTADSDLEPTRTYGDVKCEQEEQTGSLGTTCKERILQHLVFDEDISISVAASEEGNITMPETQPAQFLVDHEADQPSTPPNVLPAPSTAAYEVINLCTPEKISQITGPAERQCAIDYIQSIILPDPLAIEAELIKPTDVTVAHGLQKGDGFPEYFFYNEQPQLVESIPDDIDGLQWYMMESTGTSWIEQIRDRRYFNMRTSSRAGFFGRRKLGWCQGSFVCVNDRCNFRRTSAKGERNKNYWTIKRDRKTRQCKTCGCVAEREPCGARKMVEMDFVRRRCNVFHVGKHSCTLQPPNFYRRTTVGAALKGLAGKIPPRELQTMMVRDRVEKMDWKGARQVARDWTDMRLVGNLQRKMQEKNCTDRNSLEAVGILKADADVEDPYFIYRINDGRYNNGLDYIFKSSTAMAKLAITMDCDDDGDNPLQEEVAYFDAVHTRVIGYKSIAVWVLHPATHALLRLCNMELRSESIAYIATFFTLFNEVLAEVKGDPDYKFNPLKIMSDELAANKGALREVFGEEFVNAKCISCTWHYQHDMRLHTASIGDERDQESIRNLSTALCKVVTLQDYDDALKELQANGQDLCCTETLGELVAFQEKAHLPSLQRMWV